MVIGDGTGRGHTRLARHPGEQVARRPAELDDGGVAVGSRLGAVRGAGDDGGDTAVVVSLEADQLTPDPNDAAEIDAGCLEPRGRARA